MWNTRKVPYVIRIQSFLPDPAKILFIDLLIKNIIEFWS